VAVMSLAKRLVWAMVACATVVAQAMPQGPCDGCQRPCCAAPEGVESPPRCDVEPPDTCPLCAIAGDARPLERTEQPCSCRLTARHDQPLAASSGPAAGFVPGHAAVAPAAIAVLAPQVSGVSREYLATSLAVPIRPARILFGVWRN